jgi:hypothetical protein
LRKASLHQSNRAMEYPKTTAIANPVKRCLDESGKLYV